MLAVVDAEMGADVHEGLAVLLDGDGGDTASDIRMISLRGVIISWPRTVPRTACITGGRVLGRLPAPAARRSRT